MNIQYLFLAKVTTARSLNRFLLISLLLLFLLGCKKQNPDGLPDNIINSAPDTVLIAKQAALLPESSPIFYKYPVLFDTIHEKRLILEKDAYVYITFLHEGASWTNSLGYYTYMQSVPPSNVNKTTLFPNISETGGGGGGLNPGDMVQVGDGILPKGTVIGLFLVVQGWDSNKKKTVEGNYTNYTDRIFNENNYQQSILFIEKTTGKLVLGFEDLLLNDPNVDGDYNDIVISISNSRDPATLPTSFDLSKIPIL